MRAHDRDAAIEDALRAGEAIARFVEGRTAVDYESDLLLSSAVERQFEIVGEAIIRAIKVEPALEHRLPEARNLIGFRNVIAHDYDNVAVELVWSTVLESLPLLMAKLRVLLNEE